jgi:phosphate:Na+ symporter
MRWGALLLLIVALTSSSTGVASGQELRLSVRYPSPHTELYVGVEGDTLRGGMIFLVQDAAGKGIPGVRIRLRPPSGNPVLPDPELVTTDALGGARAGCRFRGPPGSHVILASVEGWQATPLEVKTLVLRRSWGVFVAIGIAGGLALFLYGIRLIGRGLEKVASGRLREFLGSMTANRLRSLVFGMVSTSLVQSSSASTVLLVSFAGAGLVSLGECLGAVLGAAIGSTVTVQLIAFRISDFALFFVTIGVFLTMSRGGRRRAGGVVLGFGLIFYGLQVMSSSMASLRALPFLTEFFVQAASKPLPAILIGAVFTASAQASAATIGVVLSLAFQGLLGVESAIPFVLGANIGTGTTAILASRSSNADGKRIAWAHALFRLSGALLCLPFLGPVAELVKSLSTDVPRQIAHVYTLVNVATAFLFFPFLPWAERFFRVLIPERLAEHERFGPKALDPRFHEQPSIAIASAKREVLRMGELVTVMLGDVKEALRRDDEELADSIKNRDDQVDILDEAVTKYLTDLSTEYLSEEQSGQVLDLLFITKDLELIADIVSKGLVPGLLTKKREYGLRFSDEGFHQILEFHDAVTEVVEIAVSAIATWDRSLAGRVLERKRDLSRLERRFQLDHLARLQARDPQARATTTIHVDAMNDLKRIVTHSARIAYAILGKVHEHPRDREIELHSGEA